jgi:hypothetical protein
VPREWPGERCFVLCTGESIGPQAEMITRLKGRFIAVKHAIALRPDADVCFSLVKRRSSSPSCDSSAAPMS